MLSGIKRAASQLQLFIIFLPCNVKKCFAAAQNIPLFSHFLNPFGRKHFNLLPQGF